MSRYQRFVVWVNGLCGRKVKFATHEATSRYSRVSLRCMLFGHLVCYDDVGGAGYECCSRCSWVGTLMYDLFGTPESVRQINQERGTL